MAWYVLRCLYRHTVGLLSQRGLSDADAELRKLSHKGQCRENSVLMCMFLCPTSDIEPPTSPEFEQQNWLNTCVLWTEI